MDYNTYWYKSDENLFIGDTPEEVELCKEFIRIHCKEARTNWDTQTIERWVEFFYKYWLNCCEHNNNRARHLFKSIIWAQTGQL